MWNTLKKLARRHGDAASRQLLVVCKRLWATELRRGDDGEMPVDELRRHARRLLVLRLRALARLLRLLHLLPIQTQHGLRVHAAGALAAICAICWICRT